jgi:hypothetical protein
VGLSKHQISAYARWERVRRERSREAMPYSRVGLCCGHHCRFRVHHEQALFRVRDEFRYRCRKCFRRETGHWP